MRCLFRLDMAKDNEGFVELRRASQIDHAYSGTPMKVGPGWIPDLGSFNRHRHGQLPHNTGRAGGDSYRPARIMQKVSSREIYRGS